MPMPRLLAQINKRTFNKLTLRRGVSPVLIHRGRSSGRTYETPLDATPVEGGYIFFVIYSRKTDWLKNVLAAASAQLRIEGRTINLGNPRFVPPEEARRLMPPEVSVPPSYIKGVEFLRMDTLP